MFEITNNPHKEYNEFKENYDYLSVGCPEFPVWNKIQDMNGIDFLIEDSIATITLNRQEVFNSFNTAMAKALQQCLDECDTNENIRVVLLTASGKAFCAGQDLTEILGENSIPVTQIVEENYNPISKSGS